MTTWQTTLLDDMAPRLMIKLPYPHPTTQEENHTNLEHLYDLWTSHTTPAHREQIATYTYHYAYHRTIGHTYPISNDDLATIDAITTTH